MASQQKEKWRAKGQSVSEVVECLILPSIERDHWFLCVSVVCSDRKQFSRILRLTSPSIWEPLAGDDRDWTWDVLHAEQGYKHWAVALPRHFVSKESYLSTGRLGSTTAFQGFFGLVFTASFHQRSFNRRCWGSHKRPSICQACALPLERQ